MTAADEGVFEARMTHLVAATDFAEAFCQRHGVGHRDTLRLQLVIEELFTNTVEHGHRGDSAARVRLVLGASETELSLRYEDEAPPFDALARPAAQPQDIDAALAGGRVGGLGIPLVVALAASARYAREDGFNRLWVVLRREAAA